MPKTALRAVFCLADYVVCERRGRPLRSSTTSSEAVKRFFDRRYFGKQ